jgi:DNA-binding response OmpR family regulator
MSTDGGGEVPGAMRSKVLLVEDDLELAGLAAASLRDFGCDVYHAVDLRTAHGYLQTAGWNAIVLDAQLPDGDGFELCRDLSERERAAPIMLLTARASAAERIAGLECGADDYLTKPFELRELCLRVGNLLRHQVARESAGSDGPTSQITCGDIVVDLNQHQVFKAGRLIDLTPREFDLLTYLATHSDKVFSRGELLNAVWGSRYVGFEHTVNSHINRLRAKLEADPRRPECLVTVWGLGYRLMRRSNSS